MAALRRALPALAVALAGLFALRRLDDFDTWWHLAAGRWIFENRRVPTTDTLSFTVPDHRWIDLQWLFDLHLYGLYQTGGAVLLVLAAALCVMLAVGLLARNVRDSLGPASSCLLLTCAVLVASERFVIRPELATLVLLQCALWIVSDTQGDGRRYWLLVPLMLLWVNVHALFVLGLFVIGAAVASALAAGLPMMPARWREASKLHPGARKRLMLAGVASIAVTFANPYFADGAFFPLELWTRIGTSGGAFGNIGEFRSPFESGFRPPAIQVYHVFLILGCVVVGLAGLREAWPRGAQRNTPRFHLSGLITFIAFAVLSIMARRNIAVFALGATPFLARCIRIVLARTESSTSGRVSGSWQAWTARVGQIAPALVATLVLWISISVVSNRWYAQSFETREFGTGVLESYFPVRAAEFVREQGLPGPMYNDMAAGGYLAWADPTGEGVYVDGRLEVYDAEFFARYQRTLQGEQEWKQEVDRLGIQSAFIFHGLSNRGPLIAGLVRSPEWALVYHDEVAVVLVRVRGHEAHIRRAQAAFPAWRKATEARLASPTRSWGWPVARTAALLRYAQLMETLERKGRALALYGRLLGLKLQRGREVFACTRVASLLAGRGDREGALTHLRRARDLEPRSEEMRGGIERMLRELEDGR